MLREEEDVRAQEEKATDATWGDKPSRYRSMTYEQGIRDALRWVLGDEDEAPFGEDE